MPLLRPGDDFSASMITLRQLTHARTLAHTGNFRRAAEVLHITQPALTRSIQALESTLGAQLFDRTAQGVALTRLGEAFLPKAHLLLRGCEDLTREMTVLQALEQVSLSIAMGPYPFDLYGPEVIADVGSAHPGLQCRLALCDGRGVTAQVLSREADLGVGDLDPAAGDARLSVELLSQHALHFFCRAAHPILRREEVTIEDLADTVITGTRASVRLGSALHGLGGRAGSLDKTTGDFIPTWEVNAMCATKRVVASSDAVGVAMLTQIRDELGSGTMCLVPVSAPWLRLNYGFIWRRDSAVSAGAREFIAAMRERESGIRSQESELQCRYDRLDRGYPKLCM
jgi:DNA-binding transcriptional LysR family regulator